MRFLLGILWQTLGLHLIIFFSFVQRSQGFPAGRYSLGGNSQQRLAEACPDYGKYASHYQ